MIERYGSTCYSFYVISVDSFYVWPYYQGYPQYGYNHPAVNYETTTQQSSFSMGPLENSGNANMQQGITQHGIGNMNLQGNIQQIYS